HQPDCHSGLGDDLDESVEFGEGGGDDERVAGISQQSHAALGKLAWLRATCPDSSFRDGSKALQLARRADQLSGGTNALVLRTLAAGYAEAGQFEKAIENGRAATRVAQMQGDNSLAAALAQEIALYELGLPYR